MTSKQRLLTGTILTAFVFSSMPVAFARVAEPGTMLLAQAAPAPAAPEEKKPEPPKPAAPAPAAKPPAPPAAAPAKPPAPPAAQAPAPKPPAPPAAQAPAPKPAAPPAAQAPAAKPAAPAAADTKPAAPAAAPPAAQRQERREERRDQRREENSGKREERRDDRREQRRDSRDNNKPATPPAATAPTPATPPAAAAPKSAPTPPAAAQDSKQDSKQDNKSAPAAAPPAAQAPAAAPAAPAAANAPKSIEELRRDRKETREGNRTIIREDDRTIVRDGNRTIIRHDDSDRFRNSRNARVERRGNETVTVIDRGNGVQVYSVSDADGRLIRRYRRDGRGREVVILDNRRPRGGRNVDIYINLPPPVIRIPRDRYIVEADSASETVIYETLIAPPVQRIEQRYTLDQVRYSPDVLARMPRIDIDTVTFDTGSWEVTSDQAARLAPIAEAINRVVAKNPNEVFLIEGHTDAVGSDVDNLSLSDRRAESVAVTLSQQFRVPPENLVTQGYGEAQLKVNTDGPERQNRRVTVRRITPLLAGNESAPPAQ